MAQEKIENIRTPLPQRTSPIMDEVLESCILQTTFGDRRPEPVANFEVYSIDQIKAWAGVGMSQTVAAAIVLKEIPDEVGKRTLALALEIELDEILANPAYNKNHQGLQELMYSKRVMISRLRFMK